MTKVTPFPKHQLKGWNEERAKRVYERARRLTIAYNVIEFDKEADQANWSSYQRMQVVAAVGADFGSRKELSEKLIKTHHGDSVSEYWVVQTALGHAMNEEANHGQG